MTERRTSSLLSLAAALLFISALPLAAQQAAPSPYAPEEPLPLGDVLLSLPTSHMPSARTWEVRFSHRFNESLDQGNFHDRVHSLFGLDGSAEVAIGVSYVAARDLQISLLRTNALDDIELAARYIVVQQAPAIPLSLALRGGADIRTEKGVNDRSSFFVQAIASRRIGRTEIFVVPSYLTNAGRAVSGTSTGALFNHAFNVPLGAAVQLTRAMSLGVELTPKNRDLPSSIDSSMAWAVGLKTAVGGHFFEVLLTNSNATHVDQYVTSTYQGSALRTGDLHLGFNIERRF